MNQFLQIFFHDASDKIEDIRRELQNLRELDPFDEASGRQHLRRILQQIHTLKGSAAAFGIETMRELAHEIENLLESLYFGKTVCDPRALGALDKAVESIAFALAESSDKEGNAGVLPQDWQILIKDLKIGESQTKIKPDDNILPAEFLDKLNELEKKRLLQSVDDNHSVYVFAVEFHMTEFQNQLQTLRVRLELHGEIIAALPGALTSPAQITLQIIFATSVAPSNWEGYLESFNPKILFADQNSRPFAETAASALLAGRRAAFELGKEVEFDISGGELKINGKQANALTTALLHLATNAVAHGIESPDERLTKGKQSCGKILVKAEQTPTVNYIFVIDDGGGIEPQKIAQAVEKIYGANSTFEDCSLIEAQQLIFQPGFSTTETLSQIAGRGVGLDAAQSAIESVGGIIEVSSKTGLGATFKIILPRI